MFNYIYFLHCVVIYSEFQKYWDSDTFVVVVALYSSILGLKWCSGCGVEVRAASFDLRVCLSISGEPYRNDCTLCI